jgi:hypothetical protein
LSPGHAAGIAAMDLLVVPTLVSTLICSDFRPGSNRCLDFAAKLVEVRAAAKNSPSMEEQV